MRWELARLADNSLRAVVYDGKLHITATVAAPTPGYVARVSVSPLLIFPPQFVLQQAPLGSGPEPQVITPIPACGEFGALQGVGSIVVHTLDGSRTVDIQRPGSASGDESRALGGGEIPRTAEGGGGSVPFRGEDPDVAIGWSDRFDYEEALRNACAELLHGADDRVFADVIGTGAVLGGIDGQQRIWVRVKRIWFEAEKAGR